MMGNVKRHLPEYTRKQLTDEIIAIAVCNIHCRLDPSSFNEDSDVVNDMHADSLDVVWMILDLEEKLGVTLTDDAVDGKYKIREIVDAFYNRLKLEGRIKE